MKAPLTARIDDFWQRYPVRFALLLSLAVRLVWAFIALLGLPFQYPLERFAHESASHLGYYHTPIQAIDMWARWDSNYYLDIAMQGYDSGLRLAFFPLFPLLIRGLHALTGWWEVTCGLLLANVCDIAGWALLAMLARQRLGPRKALMALVAFAIFPSRNFGFSVYTEGLFLMLSVGAFYLYERRAYGAAAVLCSLVSALRPQGILVGAALAIDALIAWRHQKHGAPTTAQLFAFALVPAGMLSFIAFLWLQFGRPLAFLQVQSVWHRHFSLPLVTFFLHGEPHEHAALIAAVALCLTMLRWGQPVRDTLYVALSLLVPMSTGSLMSMPRFVGILFPLFLFAPVVIRPQSRRARFYVTVALVYCCVMAFKVGQGAKVI